jgi:hypothetical protein
MKLELPLSQKIKTLQKYIKRHILVKALIGSVVSGEIYET